jgi:hypothetical protein
MSDQQAITDEQEDLDELYERLRIEGLPQDLQALVGEHHWNMLQATPSSVEQQAHTFGEETTS